ncbi:MAG: hypothetical protein FWG07_02900 [Treponema sp.]|nr:hypothetical protein [Treponema sp.]
MDQVKFDKEKLKQEVNVAVRDLALDGRFGKERQRKAEEENIRLGLISSFKRKNRK